MLKGTLCRFYILIALLFSSMQTWSADGRVLSFAGEVKINGVPLTADTQLSRKDTVVTGYDGTVMIVLSDNSVLDVAEDSEIVLSDYVYTRESPEANSSDVEIVTGTLRYVSGLMAKEDPTDISFSAASSTIGVRGTFTIITNSGGTVAVEAQLGEAYVTYTNASGQIQSFDVATGNALQADLATDAPPVISTATVNSVNAVVAAIVAASETGASLQAVLQDSGIAGDTEALALAVVVLNNNAAQLGVDTSVVVATVGAIAVVNPSAAATAVFVATVVNSAGPVSAGAPQANIFAEAVEESVAEALENGTMTADQAATVGDVQASAAAAETIVNEQAPAPASTAGDGAKATDTKEADDSETGTPDAEQASGTTANNQEAPVQQQQQPAGGGNDENITVDENGVPVLEDGVSPT